MSLTLPLTSIQERRLADDAARAGLSVIDYTLARLFGAASHEPDYVGEWSDEDMRDVTMHSMRNAELSHAETDRAT